MRSREHLFTAAQPCEAGTPEPHPRSVELAVVMPVYNEADCIVAVLNDWLAALTALGLDFMVFVLDDGSTDQTAVELAQFESDPRLTLLCHPNQGHGPTILAGYRRAAAVAEWVFQCDGDNEIPAAAFSRLWQARTCRDAVFGVREDRRQSPLRRWTSAGSNCAVRALFGPEIRDVNVPFRLLRAEALAPILTRIPAATLTPNILIAGAFSRHPDRIANVPVPHVGCQHRGSHLQSLRLVRFAGRALCQVWRLRRAFDDLDCSQSVE